MQGVFGKLSGNFECYLVETFLYLCVVPTVCWSLGVTVSVAHGIVGSLHKHHSTTSAESRVN